MKVHLSCGLSFVETQSAVFQSLYAAMQDVTEVVNTCHDAGISKLAVKLRPIAVIKG